MNELLRSMGLTRASWTSTAASNPARGSSVGFVVGSWLLLAWSRFGLIGITEPRATTRFVLVGVYAWLLLGVALWGATRLAGNAAAPVPVERTLLATAAAHRPLLLGSIALQFLSFVGVSGVVGLVLIVVAVLWMAGMLVAAMGWLTDRGATLAVVLSLVPLAAWLATAGRFALTRIGHLV